MRPAATFGGLCASGPEAPIPARGAALDSMASAAEARLNSVQSLELPPEHVYFGPSATMQAVRQKVLRAAGLNVPVLVLGESGTGKEVLARFIHERSP